MIKVNLVNLACLVCISFGLLTLAFVTGAGDGTWYFYSKSYLAGLQLYSDLGLVQQPLFILYNSIGIYLFGDSWIAQRVLFIPILIAFVFLLRAIIKYTETQNHVQAGLIFSIFFLAIYFPPFRFDDYHAFLHTLELLFLYLILSTSKPTENKKSHLVLLGLTIAFIVFTKITDGVLLLMGFLAIIFLNRGNVPLHRYIPSFFGIVLGVGLIFMLTNDSVEAWYRSTLIDAAAAKGGNQMWFSYAKLLKNATGQILTIPNIFYFIVFFICVYLFSRFHQRFWLVISLLFFFLFIRNFSPVYYLISFAILTLLIYSIYIAVAFLKNNDYFTASNATIYLLPILLQGLLLAGSLSSAGSTTDFTFLLAISLVVLISILSLHHWLMLKNMLIMVTICLGFDAFIHKFNTPYAWHDFSSPRINRDRQLIQTDSLGPVLVDQQLYELIQPVCEVVVTQNKPVTLLSIPFSFANYFCGIPPWHHYVQSFFDFSNPKLLGKMVDELNIAPPDFIFYQRQLKSLEQHEQLFNANQHLPHRSLDRMIMHKIEIGTWTVIYSKSMGDSNWLLISTK